MASDKVESVSVAEVRRLARAARLTLAPDEETRLARDLARILEAFSTLAPAEGGAPAPAAAPPREDLVAPAAPETVDRILAMVPRRSGRHTKVPRRGGA